MARQSAAASPSAPGKSRSGKPKKQRLQKIRQIYVLARDYDPKVPLWMALAFFGSCLVGLLIGLSVGHPWYWMFVFMPFGLLGATFLLSKKAERAAYAALEGRPGAAGAALQGLRKGWSYSDQPVAVDGGRSSNLQDAAMVFRAVGKAGVVLVAEGPTGRATRVLQTERKKVQRIVPNVPVTVYRVGDGDGDEVVTPRQLVLRMGKLPRKALTKHEITEVDKRLRALSSIGSRPPIPQGIDPQRLRGAGRGQRR